MRKMQIILLTTLFISCNETSEAQNQPDWRDEYSIIEGTGIVTGNLIVEDIWHNDDVYIYISQKDSSGAYKLCAVDIIDRKSVV